MLKKKKIPISYTSRDFNSIRSDLVEYAKRYYPNSFKDFSESSFGSLMVDSVAYVGDILSFYLDAGVNESFPDSAIEYNNIIRHGRSFGYKFNGFPSSYGTMTFYIIVPAAISGLGPDMSYLPVLLKGSEFGTTSGNAFMLRENVDFSNSNNEIVVAEVNETTGVPTSYAIKAFGSVISGELIEEIVTVGDYQKFFRARLSGKNIAEILTVMDSEGHEYFEVENLSQNIIYRSVTNKNSDSEMAQEILKPIVVPRRYVVERDGDTTYLQFGYGTDDEIRVNNIIDPKNVVLQVVGKDYITDDSFDPSKLLSTDKFGVAPSNTYLRVVTRSNTKDNVNAAVGSVAKVKSPLFEFVNISSLNSSRVSQIVQSLECTNDEPIIGDIMLPDSEELKIRIKDNFATQNRAVTAQDYKSVVYSLPGRFGGIKRCSVIQDSDSFKRNLNLYVISENSIGKLVETNNTIKQNLKTWLSSKKMLNDTIDILNANIINIGIEFEIVARDDVNKFAALSIATEELVGYYSMALDIGEPFRVTDVYQVLKNIDSVLDVVNVKIVQKNGGNYSDMRFNIENNMSADGRYLKCPENCVIEIKFPRADIKGIVR